MKMSKVLIAIALTALLVGSPQGNAATTSLYWKTDGTNPGGTGNWDLTTLDWSTASAAGSGTMQAWNNTGDANGVYAANFEGSGGVVTADSGITALQMNFNGTTGSSYTIQGGPITLTATGGGFGINVKKANTSVTVNSLINGSGSYKLTSIAANATGSTLTLAGGLNNTGASAVTYNFEGANNSVMAVTGNITKTGAGGVALVFGSASTSSLATYILSGNNSGVASSQIIQGTVVVNNNSALVGTITFGNSSVTQKFSTLLIGTSGVTVGNSISFSSDANDVRVIGSQISSGVATYAGGITLAGSNALLTSAAGGTTVYTGVITDSSNPNRAVTVQGGGKVKFAKTTGNSYDGGTVVTSNSTLLVNNTSGSGTGTAGVSVEDNSTLGGTGTISGAVTLLQGTRISAGDSDTTTIATLRLGSDLTWNSDNSSAGFLVDLGSAASADLVALTGAFTKGSGTSFLFNFADAGGFTVGNTYTLLTFGANSGFSVGDFGYTSSIANFSGSFQLNSNSLTFTTTAVPEPESLALVCGGLMLLLGMMRRRITAV